MYNLVRLFFFGNSPFFISYELEHCLANNAFVRQGRKAKTERITAATYK
jgi:hypothetical protein